MKTKCEISINIKPREIERVYPWLGQNSAGVNFVFLEKNSGIVIRSDDSVIGIDADESEFTTVHSKNVTLFITELNPNKDGLVFVSALPNQPVYMRTKSNIWWSLENAELGMIRKTRLCDSDFECTKPGYVFNPCLYNFVTPGSMIQLSFTLTND